MLKKRIIMLAGLLVLASAANAATVPPTYCYVRDVSDIVNGFLTGGNTRILECFY